MDTQKKVISCISEQLLIKEDAIKMKDNFESDLDADELDMVELIMALEEKFEFEILDEDADRLRTVEDAVNYIKEKEGD